MLSWGVDIKTISCARTVATCVWNTGPSAVLMDLLRRHSMLAFVDQPVLTMVLLLLLLCR
jgi:hypothetical protein